MNKLKYIVLSAVLGGTAVAGVTSLNLGATKLTPKELTDIQVQVLQTHKDSVDWVKPTTDAEWAEDVKKESLDVKYTEQLVKMSESHTAKLAREEAELPKYVECPDCIRWEMREQLANSELTGKALEEEIERQAWETINSRKWSVEKLQQSVERIDKEIELRSNNFLIVKERIPAGDPERATLKDNERSPLGTTYYINADCATPGNGTTATCLNNGNDSYATLDAFMEVARSAGDVAILRRGTTAQYDNNTDVDIISDGEMINPIIVEADYNDAWGDFANSAQTYTSTWGSKTMTASASITGIATNDWVYVSTDTAKDYAYEVASVSGTTLTLYLPFKGTPGSGQTLVVMPDAPIWGGVAVASAGSILATSDNNWKFQGIDFRSSDSGGTMDITNTTGWELKDVIFQSDGGGDNYIDEGIGLRAIISKFRVFDADSNQLQGGSYVEFFDGLVDLNNDFSNLFYKGSLSGTHNFQDVEVVNVPAHIFSAYDGFTRMYLRNFVYGAETDLYSSATNLGIVGDSLVYHEDLNGTVGQAKQFSQRLLSATATTTGMIESDTTTVRSGGSAKSLKVNPYVTLSTVNKISTLQLFELPIYTSTASKTYSVYFRPNATADWTADPTATELWIELEYYGSASNAYRRITKSTGTIDMNGSTDWQALTVTVAPAQEGIVYLRAYYGKPLESGKLNVFYVDVKPIIQ